MTSPILITQKNTVGFITLNHPDKHNCLSVAMMEALSQAYQDFENNTEIHAIILNANGKNFCAGADLDHMKKMASVSFEDNLKDAKNFAQFFYNIYSCKKPTICCVHGKTLGGGVGLMAAHDFTMAPKDATFSFPEVKIGLMPATIAPIVSQRIGYRGANQWMLSAEAFSAAIACEIKLIDYIADDAFAILLAEALSKNNLQAMQKTKAWLQELNPITQIQLDRAAKLLAEVRSAIK